MADRLDLLHLGRIQLEFVRQFVEWGAVAFRFGEIEGCTTVVGGFDVLCQFVRGESRLSSRARFTIDLFATCMLIGAYASIKAIDEDF